MFCTGAFGKLKTKYLSRIIIALAFPSVRQTDDKWTLHDLTYVFAQNITVPIVTSLIKY